ncbi:hypothetical protein J5N97_026223 [Dioscorea zingiberensis]|uniref:Uncharacterized protein n=1 Tax=Dioscorea zingiberensis TaxID=325984 RepID=A0A9D5H6K9_9LILI|nr:hypothetical protein J5N97_026223 [Dioscorea zingiberensis]
MVGPLGGLGRDDVGVGIEKDRQEGWVATGPGEQEKGLSGDELDGLGADADDGGGEGFEELDGGMVVRGWVSSVDLEVLLEPRDFAGFDHGVLRRGSDGKKGTEEEEGFDSLHCCLRWK